MSDLTVLSAQAPFWKALHLSQEDRAIMEEHLTPQTLKAGEILWKEGETSASCMAIVERGRMKALKKNIFGSGHIVMGILESGTIIGLPLTPQKEPKGVTLVAMDDVQLLVMCDPVFEHLMSEHLDLGLRLLRHIHTDFTHKMKYVSDRLVQTF